MHAGKAASKPVMGQCLSFTQQQGNYGQGNMTVVVTHNTACRRQ